jgi:hypothetical protein
LPGSESTLITDGPISLTKLLDISKPRPIPFIFVPFSWSKVAKALNNFVRIFSGIPTPVSITSILRVSLFIAGEDRLLINC